MLPFALPEACEFPHQVPVCSLGLQFLPGRRRRKHYFLSSQFDGQFGAICDVQDIPDSLWDRDAASRRYSNLIHSNNLLRASEGPETDSSVPHPTMGRTALAQLRQFDECVSRISWKPCGDE